MTHEVFIYYHEKLVHASTFIATLMIVKVSKKKMFEMYFIKNEIYTNTYVVPWKYCPGS